jgi:hypothetical protein
LLELIAKDPQAFIRQQGWASVSLDGERGLSVPARRSDFPVFAAASRHVVCAQP